MKYLIVNADDFGMCETANAALEDTFKAMSLPVSAVVVLAVTVALTALAYILHRKNIVIKL